MKHRISALVTGYRTIILLILANLIYLAMIFITIPKLELFSGGLRIFDMMPTGYSHEYALQLLNILDEEGRSFYLYAQLSLDLLYPLLYALANGFLFLYLIKKMGLQSKWFANIYLLPLAAALCDYAENGCIYYMLLHLEGLEQWHVAMGSVFTICKSVLTTLYFVLLLSFFIAHRINKRLKPSHQILVYQKVNTIQPNYTDVHSKVPTENDLICGNN